jgi:hypothetical protein
LYGPKEQYEYSVREYDSTCTIYRDSTEYGTTVRPDDLYSRTVYGVRRLYLYSTGM